MWWGRGGERGRETMGRDRDIITIHDMSDNTILQYVLRSVCLGLVDEILVLRKKENR